MDRSREAGAPEAGVLMAADQTDRGRERGEAACPHGWEDRGVGGGPGREVVLVGRGDREGGVGVPGSHLITIWSKK